MARRTKKEQTRGHYTAKMHKATWHHPIPRSLRICIIPCAIHSPQKIINVKRLYGVKHLQYNRPVCTPLLICPIPSLLYCESVPYFPTVLAAHRGLRFDVPILLAEIERRPNKLTASALVEENIHFADTLQCLKQVRSLLYPRRHVRNYCT